MRLNEIKTVLKELDQKPLEQALSSLRLSVIDADKPDAIAKDVDLAVEPIIKEFIVQGNPTIDATRLKKLLPTKEKLQMAFENIDVARRIALKLRNDFIRGIETFDTVKKIARAVPAKDVRSWVGMLTQNVKLYVQNHQADLTVTILNERVALEKALLKVRVAETWSQHYIDKIKTELAKPADPAIDRPKMIQKAIEDYFAITEILATNCVSVLKELETLIAAAK